MLSEHQRFFLTTDLPDLPDAEPRTKKIIFDHFRSTTKIKTSLRVENQWKSVASALNIRVISLIPRHQAGPHAISPAYPR